MKFHQVATSLFLLCSVILPGSLQAKTPQLTPMVYRVLAGPVQPVLGSDGEYHLVYEISVTNIAHLAWNIEGLEVFNQADKRLLRLEGAELKSRIGTLGQRGGSDQIGPNQTFIAWLHVKVRSKQDLPQNIHHRLSIQGEGKKMEIEGAEVAVSSEAPLEIAAPLRGERWLAGDGCCDSSRHVRALLPIDGNLYLAQRFAIDWEKLDEANKIYSGDAKNPESYFCYGQDVLAVADGEVVEMLDGLTNQVPGKLPSSIDLAQADGNHVVLKLAPNRYALYAHLKPGSVQVKIGDRVKAGQVLGQVGNTGNTSEPHLHFHIMDGPSALTANGLPYVLKSFGISGRAPNTEAFDKAAAQGTALQILPSHNGPHQNQLPLDLNLVSFPH